MRKRFNSKIVQMAMLASVGVLISNAVVGLAAEKSVGDTADNFVLTNVRTGEPVQLNDFEGSIIVLDFFSYW